MAANYVLLERIELNQTTTSISFSNIPQSGYTDLKIVVSARTNNSTAGAWDNIGVTFNNSGTGYSQLLLYGADGSGLSTSTTGASMQFFYAPRSAATANAFSNGEIYIPNYTGSTAKSCLMDSVVENNSSSSYMVAMNSGLWSGTSAITSVQVTGLGGNFVQYSTFSLYALAAVGTTPVTAPKALGGNITTDGTYWIHTFTSSGVFTPYQSLSCDYLVVAGGGGGGQGGNNVGGGGGAGGFLTSIGGSALSVSAQPYPITVGAGGAAATGPADGGNGTNSIFSTVTATGGGGGAGTSLASGTARAGLSGGSGGGASYWNFGVASGGAASPSGQGNKGGDITSSVNGNRAGAGGGGASAAATNVVSNGTGTAGGNGLASSISGSSVTYAGGGGGAGDNPAQGYAGGTGGGGAGAWASSATSGTANTGGGGGGTLAANSGAGGSGIVIIRYAMA